MVWTNTEAYLDTWDFSFGVAPLMGKESIPRNKETAIREILMYPVMEMLVRCSVSCDSHIDSGLNCSCDILLKVTNKMRGMCTLFAIQAFDKVFDVIRFHHSLREVSNYIRTSP